MNLPDDQGRDDVAQGAALGAPAVPPPEPHPPLAPNPFTFSWDLVKGAISGAPGGKLLWWPIGIIGLIGIVLWRFKGEDLAVAGGVGTAIISILVLFFAGLVIKSLISAPAPWIPGPLRVAAYMLAIGVVVLFLSAGAIGLLKISFPLLFRERVPHLGAVTVSDARWEGTQFKLIASFDAPAGLSRGQELLLVVAEDTGFQVPIESGRIDTSDARPRVPLELRRPSGGAVYIRLIIRSRDDGILREGPYVTVPVED